MHPPPQTVSRDEGEAAANISTPSARLVAWRPQDQPLPVQSGLDGRRLEPWVDCVRSEGGQALTESEQSARAPPIREQRAPHPLQDEQEEESNQTPSVGPLIDDAVH